MFKAEKFTKTNCGELRQDIQGVLDTYSEISGVKFKVGAITYSDKNASIKLDAILNDADGNYVSKEESDFDRYAQYDSISLKRGEIGNLSQLGKVRFVGYKSKNRKYPYIVETVSDGKRYKINESQARSVVRI